VPVGRARAYSPAGGTADPAAGDTTASAAGDLTIVTFGNGLRMSLRAAARLATGGIRCLVLDLRWLAPLPAADIMRAAGLTGRVLVADETRRTGGVSEAVLAALADSGFGGPVARVTSADSFIPLGAAAAEVLLSERAIEAAARDLARRPADPT
jgi:2-oxoisovalerate dehydrogenase E1 component